MSRWILAALLPVAAAAFSFRVGRRGLYSPDQSVFAAEPQVAIPALVQSDGAVHGSLRSAGGWWPDEQVPEMEKVVLANRNRTQPEIVPNVSDHVWYYDIYGNTPHNALERLSWTTNATDPTPEQIAREEARLQKAMAELSPKLEAEREEAENFYKFDLPYDANNDLDNFTRYREYGAATLTEAHLNGTAVVDATSDGNATVDAGASRDLAKEAATSSKATSEVDSNDSYITNSTSSGNTTVEAALGGNETSAAASRAVSRENSTSIAKSSAESASSGIATANSTSSGNAAVEAASGGNGTAAAALGAASKEDSKSTANSTADPALSDSETTNSTSSGNAIVGAASDGKGTAEAASSGNVTEQAASSGGGNGTVVAGKAASGNVTEPKPDNS